MGLTRLIIPWIVVETWFLLYANAACLDPFVEFNDTNCYFVSDDWVQYDDAKTVCHLLESDLYIPPKGNDHLRAQLYRQILQYLTYENYWIGVEKKITNYTTYDYEWINGNTGDEMDYTLIPLHSRRSPKKDTYYFQKSGNHYTLDNNVTGNGFEKHGGISTHHNYGEYLSEARYRSQAQGAPKVGTVQFQYHNPYYTRNIYGFGGRPKRGQKWRFLNARPKKLKNRASIWKYQAECGFKNGTRIKCGPYWRKDSPQNKLQCLFFNCEEGYTREGNTLGAGEGFFKGGLATFGQDGLPRIKSKFSDTWHINWYGARLNGNNAYGYYDWFAPEEGEEGYILAKHEGTEEEVGVLGVLDKDCKNFASIKRPWNDCDKQVELVDKIEPIPEKQKWRKEPADENGWFKFTNPETNKVLTAHKVQWLSITDPVEDKVRLAKVHSSITQPLWDWTCLVESQGRMRTVWLPINCKHRFAFVCSKPGE